MVSPSATKPVGVRRRTSSITPSTATTGVGRIAVSPVWLYSDTLPPVTGTPSETQRVLEPTTGLGELPHHRGVLGRAEVQAVRDRQRHRATAGDVAEGLGQRELGTGVRVELAEAAVAVGGDGDPEMGVLVDPHHAGVGGLREHGVALHVAVVLVGDPRLVAEVGRGGETEHGLAQLDVVGRPRQRLGSVSLQVVLPVGARQGAVVRRAVVGHRPWRDVDHGLAVPHRSRAGRTP